MSIGIWQIVLIVALILIFFGRGKISAFMKDLGKGITSFKAGMKEGDKEEPIIEDKAPPKSLGVAKEDKKKPKKSGSKSKSKSKK